LIDLNHAATATVAREKHKGRNSHSMLVGSDSSYRQKSVPFRGHNRD